MLVHRFLNPFSCPALSLFMHTCFYRPQTEFAKVMFSQVSVCPLGGVCHTPWADTPQAGPPSGQTPPPNACWDTNSPCPVHAGVHTPTQCMLGYTPPPSACWDTHIPPQADTTGYSQQAGGTHPTEMHSCWWLGVCVFSLSCKTDLNFFGTNRSKIWHKLFKQNKNAFQ